MKREDTSGVEHFSTTLIEKFLAVVLTVFLLVAGFWTYATWVNFADDLPYEPACLATPTTSEFGQCGAASDRRAALALTQAIERRDDTTRVEDAAQRRDEAREAYRTALDAGAESDQLKRAYDSSVTQLNQERARHEAARIEASRLRPAGVAARDRLQEVVRSETKRLSSERNRREQVTFITRLAFVALALVLSYLLFQQARRRHSRYTILTMSMVAASTILAFGMAVDYLDIQDKGPVIISALGIALTVAVFVSYQRFLGRRAPRRRVRKHQCMYCSYPVGDETHCEGCGQLAFAACVSCGARRRVGTAYCGSCGATG